MAEDGGSCGNARMKSYKNKGMDQSEMRRRREEEGIQLRKQKREEHVREIIFKLFIYIDKIDKLQVTKNT